ncbi:hypothetical protein [Fibrella forsythiae]|uniref:Uncharacterized protein n=1 Tax=Fibrella forsythiae TaxID=2817061 RepID=A0ABS3JT54_9BACT|nr:hypothetical protein [Fibrella forsythiae]MBO0952633.1 hypothetical protein [Fibrella forsythiae]
MKTSIKVLLLSTMLSAWLSKPCLASDKKDHGIKSHTEVKSKPTVQCSVQTIVQVRNSDGNCVDLAINATAATCEEAGNMVDGLKAVMWYFGILQ